MLDKCPTTASRPRNSSAFITSPHRNTSPRSRRPPATHSVSLRHTSSPRKPSRLNKVAASSDESNVAQKTPPPRESAATHSPSSLEALVGKGSSGESSSNADKWFEKSNNDVRENDASFADNDSPFFMRNSSSSQTPPDVEPQQRVQHISGLDGADSFLPQRTGLLRLGTDGSSTDDFRSVIDDLTIENKRLKRRLKKYEKLQDAHLKDEKLFEVRVHGLSADKKRELEETLRKFASSLSPAAANAFAPNGYASLLPMLRRGKTSSSQTSLHHTDSAYASMSASGQGSSAQLKDDRGQTPNENPAFQRQSIHNYLHHIPEGLLPPQNPAIMSERAKRRLVVRRMEQIFAGKGATTGGHQHSEQQQEVSQSAAQTDRSAMEAAGYRARLEGSREAHIMNREGDEQVDAAYNNQQHTPSDPDTMQLRTGDDSTSRDLTDQRPTRPLDLDPHRAQVPAENIRYLQQMGFSPPGPELNRAPEEGHGWIYLNFLINMAQLHTINVTTEFVRKSLGDYSDRFEVSPDGRKVRWKGGDWVTRSSPSGGGSSNDPTHNNTPDGQSPRKRPKLTHTVSRSSVQQIGATSQTPHPGTNKHSYTPLFFHRAGSDDTDGSSSEEEVEENMSSPYRRPIAGDSSGMTSSGRIQSSLGLPGPALKKKQKHEDGPIIFYNNARFCTDLSGDPQDHTNYSAPLYTVASTLPIGKQRSGAHERVEMRGPLAKASQLPEPMDLGDNPIPEKMELYFPAQSPPRPHASRQQKPIDLEVTGIGGVWPADNFSISVESRQARVLYEKGNAQTSAGAVAKAVPPRFADLLHRESPTTSTAPRVRKEVIASTIHRLPPSKLPPALNFMPFGNDSEDDSDASDMEDDQSSAPESLGALPPSAAPQPVDIRYATSDEEDDDDDDDDYDDDDDGEDEDGEIDFLASARVAEPEAVRRQEREYDANMADRLADEIPAGSSAATAGGGSGFTSPVTGVVGVDEYRRALRDAKGSVTRQKQALGGKGSATALEGREPVSSEEDADADGDVRSDIES